MSKPLPHYLRYHRRLAGLEQEELALLLGSESGTKLSRYEHRTRVPTLKTALALEVIFGIPTGSLFQGMREDARDCVKLRMKTLLTRNFAKRPRALAFLRELEHRLSS